MKLAKGMIKILKEMNGVKVIYSNRKEEKEYSLEEI